MAAAIMASEIIIELSEIVIRQLSIGAAKIPSDFEFSF